MEYGGGIGQEIDTLTRDAELDGGKSLAKQQQLNPMLKYTLALQNAQEAKKAADAYKLQMQGMAPQMSITQQLEQSTAAPSQPQVAQQAQPGIQMQGARMQQEQLARALQGGGLPSQPMNTMQKMAGGGIVSFDVGGSVRAATAIPRAGMQASGAFYSWLAERGVDAAKLSAKTLESLYDVFVSQGEGASGSMADMGGAPGSGGAPPAGRESVRRTRSPMDAETIADSQGEVLSGVMRGAAELGLDKLPAAPQSASIPIRPNTGPSPLTSGLVGIAEGIRDADYSFLDPLKKLFRPSGAQQQANAIRDSETIRAGEQATQSGQEAAAWKPFYDPNRVEEGIANVPQPAPNTGPQTPTPTPTLTTRGDGSIGTRTQPHPARTGPPQTSADYAGMYLPTERSGIASLPTTNANKIREAYEKEMNRERSGWEKFADWGQGVGESRGTSIGQALIGGGSGLRRADDAERDRKQAARAALMGLDLTASEAAADRASNAAISSARDEASLQGAEIDAESRLAVARLQANASIIAAASKVGLDTNQMVSILNEQAEKLDMEDYRGTLEEKYLDTHGNGKRGTQELSDYVNGEYEAELSRRTNKLIQMAGGGGSFSQEDQALLDKYSGY